MPRDGPVEHPFVELGPLAVSSNAGDDDTCALGETTRVRLTFGEKVAVYTTDGKAYAGVELEYHTTGGEATRLEFGLGAEDAAELGAQLVQLRDGAHHRRPLSTFSAASMPDQALGGPGRAVAAVTMSFRASKARNGPQKTGSAWFTLLRARPVVTGIVDGPGATCPLVRRDRAGS